ncbi:MAG: hypothetical protein GX444_19570, partial [Myxococcales bacterium]|nr:hypothetical protein [Myxococcales bacterium]
LAGFQRARPEDTVARGQQYGADEIIRRPVNFSFLPGLNTNFGLERPIKNNFSVNLLVDWSDYLDGAELSTVGNIRLYDVRGFMGSSGFNYVGGNQVGAQAALLNINLGDVRGAQASLANYAGSLTGAQLSLVDIVPESVLGLQGSLVNYAGNLRGAQLAEVNVASGNVTGLQASLVNYASEIRGAQLGLVNVNLEADGAAVGLVNFSRRINGAQVGLVNLAVENNGEAVGLINYAGNGLLAPTVWTSDTGLVNAGVKLGTRHVYTLFGAGLQPLRHDGWYSAIFGLGGHVDFSPWWLDIDLISHELFAFDDSTPGDQLDQLAMLRFMAGYRINDAVSFYAGPTLNFLTSSVRRDIGPDWSFGKFSREVDDEDSDDRHGDKSDFDRLYFKFYPGLVIGVQFEPQVGNLNRHGK